MLIAERANQVYGRTDGGDGAALAADGNVLESKNTPPDEMPKRWWNLALVSCCYDYIQGSQFQLSCSF